MTNGRTIRNFKSTKTDQLRLYGLPPYFVKIIRPITDKMINNSTVDADGDTVFEQPVGADHKKLQAIISVINACRPEIQQIIMDTLKDEQIIPKKNLIAFGTYIQENTLINPVIKNEFLDEVLPFMKTIASKQDQLNKETSEKLEKNRTV